MTTTITNSDLIKEVVDGARLNAAVDQVPNQLSEKVVATMETNPKFFRFINTIRRTAGTTGTLTVYTTPTDRDFYLCGLTGTITKNVTSDATLSQINIVPDGYIAVTILEFSQQSLTAESRTLGNDFNIPIKLKRGSTITMDTNQTAGTTTRNIIIWGYTVDASNQ
jgi:hypothetical protein